MTGALAKNNMLETESQCNVICIVQLRDILLIVVGY
jgi:hypothetical protein